MGLDKKIAAAEAYIHAFHARFNGNIFISFSGGKDSTVLMDIALRLYPELPAVYGNTTNEDPDVLAYVLKTFGKRVQQVTPKMTFTEVLERHGFPLVSKEVSQKVYELKHSRSEKLKNIRVNGYPNGSGKLAKKWHFLAKEEFNTTHKCCHILKKEPLERWAKENGGRKPLIALMADESKLRKQLALYGKEGDKGYPFLRTGWTEADIWAYADLRGLRFAECYYGPEKETRTGCSMCGFGCHLGDEYLRFDRQRKRSPKRYAKIMAIKNNGVTFREALTTVGVTLPPEKD
jgi:3'-phosphoadenosine 5'-phosphosulfate sulfotransferase (PAPS reductase)/FAD synthetase